MQDFCRYFNANNNYVHLLAVELPKRLLEHGNVLLLSFQRSEQLNSKLKRLYKRHSNRKKGYLQQILNYECLTNVYTTRNVKFDVTNHRRCPVEEELATPIEDNISEDEDDKDLMPKPENDSGDDLVCEMEIIEI
eukprot:gb/GECH01009007.1/.p1 GENE.gb/GECH01009007.1/~~gb/GECH01009007.1/.p1  ORF type:complete len:135 (+),score=17.51 gb/GECH01009007.1/:1-405(+)